jgi:hypothetical protein
MMQAPPQFVPQAIMAGANLGAMNREQLKGLVVSGQAEDILPVVFLIEGAKARAERLEHEALVEGGWIMSADEEDLLREGLEAQGMEGWKIEAILAGRQVG